MKLSSLALVALCAAVLLPQPCHAGGYLYSGKRKTINCGVLVLGATVDQGYGTWPTPWKASWDGGAGDLFNWLDSLVELKPAGWSLDNPYAPADPQGNKFDKRDPRFWQVRLETARNLTRMDVLYLVYNGPVVLKDVDREKLRRFVDAGGVLWIDNAGGKTNPLSFGTPGTFFIPDLYFTNPGTGYDVPWSRHHPLLTMPYWLDDQETIMLGADWGGAACHPGYDVGGGMGWGPMTNPPITSDVLFPVVAKNDGSAPSVCANSYGSGRVVATANYVGRGCFATYPYCLPSLKLAYNILAWSSCWTDLRKDPRRSGRSIDTVGGSSLVNLWTLPSAPPNGESGAIVYKNIAYYSSGNTLYAMDAMPMEDLDNDGNPDDGVQDMSSSTTGVDRIWAWPCPDGVLSSPTVVTLPDPKSANKTVEAVLVMSSGGTVYMLDAFPQSGSRLSDSPVVLTSWPTESTPNPNPPICANGWVYTTSGSGRLFAYSPTLHAWLSDPAHSGTNTGVPFRWSVPDETTYPNTYSTLKSGPLFGYVTASNSQAVTGMIYWCVSAPDYTALSSDPNNPGYQTAHEQNDYIYGLPVCVKNDRLKLRATKDNAIGEYATSYPDLRMSESLPDPVIRCSSNVNPGWALTDPVLGVHPNSRLISGNIVSDATTQGSFVLEFNGNIPPDAAVFADYSVAYGRCTIGGNDTVIAPMPRVRAALQPSSISSDGGTWTVPKTEVSAMPALGQDNVLFLAGKRNPDASYSDGSPNLSGGTIYAIKNDGTSNQAVKWAYMLHSGVPASTLSGLTNAPLPIPGLLRGKPANATEASLFSAAIQAPQCYSSPVVAGDKVFVTVTGTKSPGGALLCLKSSSDFVIRIMENSGFDEDGKAIKHPKQLWDNTDGRAIQVKIWQPNLMCGPTGFGVSMEAIQVPANMIDRNKGTITFTDFQRLKMKGGIGALQETNMFSPSLPVWVLLDEQEIPIDWNTWGPTNALGAQLKVTVPQASSDSVDLSGWNNLLWYYAPPNCSGIHSSPVLIGNCVYFVTDDGILYSVNAETGETLGGPIDTDKHKDFVTWREPVEPTGGGASAPYIASESLHVSPSGSNGVLLVPGPTSLRAYANPTTLVADSNRLVEIDSGGSITWSLDSIHVPASVPDVRGGSSSNPLPRRDVPVNKPSRARYMETGQIMLVNTGANMVCKTDKSGNVGVQQITTLSGTTGWIKMMYDRFDDPKHLLRPGQPKTLSSPNDAMSWMEYEPGAGSQRMVMHCLIADSGNSRVLDLVYRFNSSGQLMNTGREDDYGYFLPELNWVTDTETKGERYTYECIQLVPDVPAGSTDPASQSVWAAISNYRSDPTVPNPQGLGGAVVQIAYRTRLGSGEWDYVNNKSGHIVAGCDKYKDGTKLVSLASPRFFQVTNEPAGRTLLVCDNNGVFKLGLGSGAPTLLTSLTDEAYRNIDRDSDPNKTGPHPFVAPLLATSAQEMPNHKWLIANSYAGKQGLLDGFQGEIFEYDPATSTISWSAPKVAAHYADDPSTPAPDPVFMGFTRTMGLSYTLQQPRCAFRQF